MVKVHVLKVLKFFSVVFTNKTESVKRNLLKKSNASIDKNFKEWKVANASKLKNIENLTTTHEADLVIEIALLKDSVERHILDIKINQRKEIEKLHIPLSKVNNKSHLLHKKHRAITEI